MHLARVWAALRVGGQREELLCLISGGLFVHPQIYERCVSAIRHEILGGGWS